MEDLAQVGTRGATLRETLQTFLPHHRSRAAAAQAMNPHRRGDADVSISAGLDIAANVPGAFPSLLDAIQMAASRSGADTEGQQHLRDR